MKQRYLYLFISWSRLYLRVEAPVQRPKVLETISRRVCKFSGVYPFLTFSDFHLPCFWNNLSFISKFAFAVASPSDLYRLCKLNCILSNPIIWDWSVKNISYRRVTNGFIQIFQFKTLFTMRNLPKNKSVFLFFNFCGFHMLPKQFYWTESWL